MLYSYEYKENHESITPTAIIIMILISVADSGSNLIKLIFDCKYIKISIKTWLKIFPLQL